MAVQTFRDLLTTKPFRPFTLVMSSGERYEVRHPEMVMLMKTDILVGLELDHDDNLPARFKICPMLHVTAIEPLEANATPSD